VGTNRVLPAYYSPIGFQKLTVSNSAVGFTLPSSPQVRSVIFGCETDQIRFKVDGTSPDSTTGLLVNAGDVVEITNVDMINNFKAIRVTTDATLQITYFGGGV
jgi:hypothetical protein